MTDSDEKKAKFSKLYREADEAYDQFSSKGGRLILWSILIFFVCILVWASLAEVDQVIRGQGKVIPSRHVQVLQSLEGGVVSDIFVDEGDIVEKGQLLIKLDDTQVAAALRENKAHCMEHRATAARLKAEAEKSEFRAPDKVLKEYPEYVKREYELYLARKEQHERLMKSLQKELDMMQPLIKEGAVSELDILKLERKLDEVEDQYCTESRQQLNELRGEISRLEESNEILADKLEKTKIKAPLKGIVKQVMVKTVGGVIKPGVDLIEIVPLDDTLLIEAKVLPSDIAFLHPGQMVTVKFSAYDYTIYGGLKGEIETISADSIVEENNESFYKITVRTEKSKLGNDEEPLPIIPGMSVTVDIITGKKTILEYLLKPVMRAKEMALREG
jgi:adhesin transport system membrane fusion protein